MVEATQGSCCRHCLSNRIKQSDIRDVGPVGGRRVNARPQTFYRIWCLPAVIALLSGVGLMTALLGQGGAWWVISWTALTAPLFVVARAMYVVFNR